MRNKNFEETLKLALHQAPPDAGHLRQTCLLAGKEMQRRRGRRRISYAEYLSMQIKFIGWKIWAAQGALLLAILGMFKIIYGEYFLEYPQAITRVLFGLSVLIVMTALPMIYRSVRYHMQEMEAASYFSSVKLLAAKLTVIGIGDITMLMGIFAMTVIQTPLGTDRALLYLLFPFLLVSGGGLFMLGHLSPKSFFTGTMGLCFLLMAACFAVPGNHTILFEQSFSTGWLLACGLLAAFCVQQLRYLVHRSPYTEMQIA